MDLSQALARLAESAALMVRGDAAAIYLLDEGGTQLGLSAAYGLPDESPARPPQKAHLCPLDQVVIADTQAGPGAESPISNLFVPNFHSAVCAPMLHENRPLGALLVYAVQPACFRRDDATRLEPLAELGAATVASDRALAELKTVEDRQAQFVRIATHELRSPVSVSQSLVRGVLKGYAGAMTDKQAEVFARISRRLDLLETLINDLLDLAAGKAQGPAKEEPVALNASIGRVMLLLQPRAEDKDVRITFEPCREQLVVMGTEDGLDRIFVNLVGNAVKYTPSGGAVKVIVQLINEHARVEVTDTGIGIPAEALPHLFEEFYRAPNAKKLAEVGTGLGLAIVKGLVDRYGGRIQVDSTVGKGTTFTVTFPLISAGAV
jgi:signal transduction histidine kinase